jgi:hypothetical protein
MSADPNDLEGLEQAVAEHNGVRVWSVLATSQQDLTDRVAVVLGEHMTDSDELYVTYAVVQNGSEPHAQRRMMREPKIWTELSFEYSAMIVLRGLSQD